MNHPQQKLCIIIPAYKGAYLARALESLVAQTDQRFRVYVGDDASPEGLEAIVRVSGLRQDQYVYHRFSENLGGQSLVQHWHRCIGLSTEPWVWLFSDDDELEPGCVSAFHRTLEKTGERVDICRFNTVMIDAFGAVRRISPPHPREEHWREFAYYLLRNLRFCVQQECVFRRRRYEDVNGFLDLPLAWCSDHAFAVAAGTHQRAITVEGPRVRFRMSGANISSVAGPSTSRRKVDASMLYIRWFMAHLSAHPSRPEGVPGNEMLREAALEWFERSLGGQRELLTPGRLLVLARFVRDVWGDSLSIAVLRILRVYIHAAPEVLTNLGRVVGVRGVRSWKWG